MPHAVPTIPAFGVGKFYELQGPTGESNQYIILPRHCVLSIADNEASQLQQLLAIFAVSSTAAVTKDNAFFAKTSEIFTKRCVICNHSNIKH